MKIAIISDLHPVHWKHFTPVIESIAKSIEEEQPDVLVNAGDCESDFVQRELESMCENYIYVPGNHDYYGARAPGLQDGLTRQVIGGKTFVTATLWSDLSTHERAPDVVGSYLSDFRLIKGMTTDYYQQLHDSHKRFLNGIETADVVVTHHLPSFRSVHERWLNGGLANCGFASMLDDTITKIGAKLFIHGHTHDRCVYKHGDTLVACNPLGYPNENPDQRNYTPIYISI